MTINDTIGFQSLYSIGGHFLFYSLLTVHLCLFVDISPLQHYPTCKLNYLIASVIAAAIPSSLTSFIIFPSISVELIVGIACALILSVTLTLTIQRILRINIDF